MKNPFQNNCFCIAFVVVLLLVIVQKCFSNYRIIENIPSRLGSPGMVTGTEQDNERVWKNIPESKTIKLNRLNNRHIENFSAGIATEHSAKNMIVKEEVNDEVDEEADDNEYTNSLFKPNLYSAEENIKRLGSNNNVYNTGAYPQPIDDRPDLSQCQPCPLKCEPCLEKKTVIVHELSPELLEKIKKELKGN